MSFTGDGPDGPPAKCGPPLSDITAGIIAAMGMLAAYAHRLKTGKGQWVETSLFEAALVQTYWQSAIALATGVAPRAMGSAHPLNAPYQAFEAADGWIVVGGANQRNWLQDRRRDRRARARERPALRAQSGAHGPSRRSSKPSSRKRFRLKPAAHWLAVLDELGVPAGPVNDMLQALSDPQTIAREMVVELEHPTAGPREGDRLPGEILATRPARCGRPRPCSARTRARSWPSTASAPTRSRRSRRRAPWSPTARIDRQKVA